jgi:hypothetical protein
MSRERVDLVFGVQRAPQARGCPPRGVQAHDDYIAITLCRLALNSDEPWVKVEYQVGSLVGERAVHANPELDRFMDDGALSYGASLIRCQHRQQE